MWRFESKVGMAEGKTPGEVAIHYLDLNGEADNPPVILLIMGLACQLTAWPQSLVHALRRQGYRVVVFDNRDIGLSTEIKARLKGPAPLAFARYKLGLSVDAPYDLYTMAEDAVRLLDHLNISVAHVVGASMGGMIAQILSARYPSRVGSATLIMTSDNHPSNPAPDWNVLWHMNGGGIKGHHLEAAMKRAMNFWEAVQSPDYPCSAVERQRQFEASFQRSYRPAGILRQMRAIMATGHLRDLYRDIRVPVHILHGDADPLVKPACGEGLHRQIAGSRLTWIPGMGHDLPEPLMPILAGLIGDHVRAACRG